MLHRGLLERGLSSILLCRRGSELSCQNIEGIIQVPWAGEWDLFGLIRLLRLSKSGAYSTIHCHDAHALSHGSVIGKMLKVPVIYTRRVLFPLHGNLYSRWKYRQCSMLIAISNAVASQCRSIVAEEKIRIIPDSADWNRSILPRSEARKALGIHEKGFVIGSVGYFTREKNVSLLVSLAHAIKETFPEICIACIGPIDDRIGPIPNNLVCTGLKSDAINYYNAFDLYVSSSTHEGLGSALLDAVVRDIPVVAIDGGGTRDIFPDNWPLISPYDETGFIAAVKNAIENPSQARERALVCGKRARGIFSVERAIEKTVDLYNEILDRK